MSANKRIIITNEEDTKKVNVSTRGDTDVLSTEIVDENGDQFPFATGFKIPAFDCIALTYVASGNGEGEIETVVYKTGGESGTIVATLTLVYNSSDEISSITKT